MAQHVVNITNGAGSQALVAGNYTVTAAVTGYTGTLDPTTFTATSSTGSQAFTIAATGTLTLNVNDTGAVGGAPITSGTFIRCNADGSQTYGTAKSISALGVCVFDAVPFGTVGSPVAVYMKQLTSDATHNIYPGVLTASMTAQMQSQYVLNGAAALQSFTFTDANYSGLNMDGTLTFDGPQ